MGQVSIDLYLASHVICTMLGVEQIGIPEKKRDLSSGVSKQRQ